MENELRLYAVVRANLEIPTGKLVTQTGHAYLGVLLQCLEENPELADEYIQTAHQTMVCVNAKNLKALERVARECEAAGIMVHVVEDAGLTVFPKPTVTALGLGPVLRNQLPPYVQRLQLR